MSRRIGILAALPSELKPLVRGWTRAVTPRGTAMWTHVDDEGDEIVAACAGMGGHAARRAFVLAETRGSLDLVLSVGLAGATGATSVLGEVSSLSEIVDVQSGERYVLTDAPRTLRLATVARTANATEKARLASSYGAALVDMEAATVARLAAMRELPMACFKAVSDTADATLPDLDRFIDHEGQLQLLRFLGYLALRPGFWAPVASLAKSSRMASLGLAEKIAQFLRHKDWAYTNRTGAFEKQ